MLNQDPRPRYTPQSATRQIRPRSREVMDYHYDDQKPGKPLFLLIPGGLIAIGALALIVFIAYQTWFAANFSQELGLGLSLLLAPFYIGGVFLFSYGYELYDVPKALRLTAIVVFITFASVIIIAVLFVVLSALSKDGNSSSSSSSSSSSGGGSSSRSSGGFLDGIGPIFINPGSSTHTVTREVVREVPVAAPAPEPITCSHCGRPYIPEENKYACPNCGAPTPPELVPQ